MAFGFAQYQRAGNVVASPREMEAQVFSFINRHLTEAVDANARIKSLHRNHKLWSLLLKDVALTGNALPDDLKRSLTSLAIWAMRYSTQALTEKLPLKPLIDVNQQMIEALTTQAPAQALPVGVQPVLTGALTA